MDKLTLSLEQGQEMQNPALAAKFLAAMLVGEGELANTVAQAMLAQGISFGAFESKAGNPGWAWNRKPAVTSTGADSIRVSGFITFSPSKERQGKKSVVFKYSKTQVVETKEARKRGRDRIAV